MPRRAAILVVCASVWGVGCSHKPPPREKVSASVAQASDRRDGLAVYEELEALIAEGRDTEDDRVYAHDRVKSIPDDHSAAYAFARGALAGRVAELRGVEAGKLVTEAETWARRSRERDPEWRGGEATRMLGTLYVKAPPRLVEHGDSEEGLAMLEALAEQRPDDLRNHLRLAEAYVHLGDPDPAFEPLCRVLPGRKTLRPDEQKLVDALVEELGGADALSCEQGGKT